MWKAFFYRENPRIIFDFYPWKNLNPWKSTKPKESARESKFDREIFRQITHVKVKFTGLKNIDKLYLGKGKSAREKYKQINGKIGLLP